MAAIVDLALKLLLGVAGLYLAHSIGRHVALKISERRLEAYSTLWEITKLATPTRLTRSPPDPLTRSEREQLHDRLQNWYYKSGNGMLMTNPTRVMFLKVKDNLVAEPGHLSPGSFAAEVKKAGQQGADAIRGRHSIRQLSLLRTRMKADFRLFGVPYNTGITAPDEEFLRDCGETLSKRPWSS